MKQRGKQLLSVLLTLVMLLGMIPGMTLGARADGDVAQIGGNRYQTLQAALDALDAAETEQTVQLIADVTENVVFGATYNDGDELWEDNDISATLDLNGHSITGKGSGSVICVFGSTLTLTDSTVKNNTAATHYYKIDDTTHLAEIIDKDTYEKLADTVTKGSFVGGYITGGIAENGGGVLVCDPDGYEMVSPAFNLDAGTIIGNKATKNGGGICIDCNAEKIRMSVNGNLVGNNAGGDGGGIWCYNAGETVIGAEIAHNYAVNGGGAFHQYGKFELNNSHIHHNTATNGGGVFVVQGEFDITNETQIDYNTASANGGGLYAGEDSNSVLLKNSTIQNNNATEHGGGAYLKNSFNFTPVGRAVVKDNGKSNLYIQENEKNKSTAFVQAYENPQMGQELIYLYYVSLSSGSKIGITLSTGDGVFTAISTVQEGANNANDSAESLLKADYFFSDDPSLTVALTEDNELQLIHEHKLDDADESASKETFTKFSTLTPTDGVYTIAPEADQTLNYYLDADVTGRIDIEGDNNTHDAVINLCLNGHKINASGTNGSAITIGNYVTLNLCDCHAHSEAAADRHYYKVVDGLGVVQDSAEEATGSFVGGYITGGNAKNDGGGVNVNGDAFNLYGGTIIGNQATDGGGGVYSWNPVTQYGGAIIGNKATNGGGVLMGAADDPMRAFTMMDGVICDNTATNGGGVYMNAAYAAIKMQGGTIRGNKAENGGGVYVGEIGDHELLGGTIAGNQATNGGGVYAKDKVTISATVNENTATYGGGVFVAPYTYVKLSGACAITGNTAATQGGGVYFKKLAPTEEEDSTLFVIRDAAKVCDNTLTDPTTKSNVYMFSGKKIWVGDRDDQYHYQSFRLQNGANIGLTLEAGAGVFTDLLTADQQSAYKNESNALTGYFFSDNPSYGVLPTEEEEEDEAINQLKLDTAYPTPTANTLTYDGSEQLLATAPEITDGYNITYSSAENGTYSETIPTGKEARSYEVWYKVFETGKTEPVGGPTKLTVTIAKKSVTVSGITAADKTYDGNTTATLETNGAIFEGLLEDDTLTVKGTGTFDTANAGTGKKVTISELVLDGAAKGNYVLALEGQQTETMAKITPKLVTITANAQSVEVNGTATGDGLPLNAAITDSTDIAKAVTADGLLAGHSLSSVTLEAVTSAVTTAGKVTPKDAVVKDGSDNDVTSNYSFTYTEGTLTVTLTQPNVTTWPTPDAITYGQTLNDSTLTDDGSATDKNDSTKKVAGTFTWMTPDAKPTVSDSGTPKYKIVFTPTDSENYGPVEQEVTITVNPATLTVTADAKKKVYNADLPTLTYRVEGLQNDDTAEAVLEGELTTTANKTSDVGTDYAINQGSLALTGEHPNYTLNFTDSTMTVIKAAQDAPALGEGYTIAGNQLTIKSDTNTSTSGVTHYEVYDGTETYEYGQTVTIEPGKTYYIRWCESDNYAPSNYTEVIIKEVTVTYGTNGETKGTVHAAGLDGDKCNSGATVTLTATPTSEGYRFAGWVDKNGKTVSTESVFSFIATDNVTYTAIFTGDTVVALPTVTKNHTYDNSEQTGFATHAGYTISPENANKGKAAGVYKATLQLNDGYVWPDGTKTDKSVTWRISKAKQLAPVVTDDGTTITITAPGDTVTDPRTIQYSTDGGRKWTDLAAGSAAGTINNADGTYLIRYKETANYDPSSCAIAKVNPLPTVTSEPPSDISANGVTLHGKVSPDSSVASLHFRYCAVGSDEWTTVNASLGSPFASAIDGLSADTDYEFQAYATLNDSRTADGEFLRFRTAAAEPASGELSITVSNKSSEDKTAVVTIESGNTVIAVATSAAISTGSNGTVSFETLPYGAYNVVVRTDDGSYTETQLTVISGAATSAQFIIPNGNLATLVEVQENTPQTAANGLSDVLSTEDRDNAAIGAQEVEVKLEAKTPMLANIPAEVAGINTLVDSGTQQVDAYLDLALFKTTTALDSSGKATDVNIQNIGSTNSKVLEIAINYPDAKTKELALYRYHDSVAEMLTALSSKPSGSFVDGTFFADSTSGVIYLYASGFSIYAIGSPKASGTTPGNSYDSDVSSGGAAPAPAAKPTTPAKTVASPVDTGVANWLITDDHIVYLRGYEDGTIRPTGSITRAEVAMMFYRLLKDKNIEAPEGYVDVSAGMWYSEAVNALSSLGILSGYGDKTFLPNNPISRAEFAAVATRFAIAAGGDASFPDIPNGYWAEANIATAAKYGWINGYEDGAYRPSGNITRAEAATIVNHMLGRAADEQYVLANRSRLVQFSDLQSTSVWYYFDMVEASTAHNFTTDGGAETWKAK